MGTAIIILVIGGIVALVVLTVLFAVIISLFRSSADKKKISTWVAMANRLGFQVKDHASYLVLMGGQWKGQKAQAHVWRTRSVESTSEKIVRTQIAVYWPRSPALGLNVTKDGFVSRMIGKAVGAQDIQVGDPHFDHALVIKGNDPAAVRAFLQPALRAEMLRLIQHSELVEFNDYGGAITFRKWVTDEQEIVFWLDELAKAVASVGDGRLHP